MKDRFFLLLIVLFLLASFTHAQNPVSVSGMVEAKATQLPLSFANLLMKRSVDSVFVAGTISDEQGRFRFSGILPGRYFLDISLVGYLPKRQSIFIGNLSQFLELKPIDLESNTTTLNEIIVSSQPSGVNDQMNKFTFNVSEGIAQAGGSVMQMMRSLPGVTIQDGKVMLRGNDKVVVLVDGKQTALTGFGNQTGLDNIPASALERIEIINNPSSKYDANGNAGIINLVYKKSKKDGFNGKLGMAGGLGALWEKKGNLPQIRPQYKATPKLNPSLSLNYRKNNTNLFFREIISTQRHSIKMNLWIATMAMALLSDSKPNATGILRLPPFGLALTKPLVPMMCSVFQACLEPKKSSIVEISLFSMHASPRGFGYGSFWKMNSRQLSWPASTTSTNFHRLATNWCWAITIPFTVRMKNIFSTISFLLIHQKMPSNCFQMNKCQTSTWIIPNRCPVEELKPASNSGTVLFRPTCSFSQVNILPLTPMPADGPTTENSSLRHMSTMYMKQRK
jgi:hypothetical protein